MDKVGDLSSSCSGESWAEECVMHSPPAGPAGQGELMGTTLSLLYFPIATSQLCILSITSS